MIGTAEEKRDGPWWASSRDYRYDYEYDLAGNRTDKAFDNTMTVSGGFYEFNDFNQLVYCEDSSETWFTYDLNGNLIKKQVIDEDALHYHHNRENRLVAFGVIDEHEELIGVYYTYDHTGRLLMRTDSAGNKTKYYYDGINNLLLKEKPDGGTCWRTKRVYALQQASIGQVLATRDYNYSGTSCTPADHLDTWYKYNDVGNVIATLDYDGNITARIDMDSFGTVHQGGYNTPRLTTKEYDADSELYYFGARWYDKNLAQWAEFDPLGFGPHLLQSQPPWEIEGYSFVANNPVFYTDPLGLAKFPKTQIDIPFIGGRCCNSSGQDEWGLVDGHWVRIPSGACTGWVQDCDGMTCGGGFYWIGDLSGGTCATPRIDDKTFAPRRWTPAKCGSDGLAPDQRGSPKGHNTPPGYDYDL